MWQEIGVRVVGQGGEKMQSGDEADSASPAMRGVTKIVDLTKRGDGLGLIEAAAQRQIGLEHVGCARL